MVALFRENFEHDADHSPLQDGRAEIPTEPWPEGRLCILREKALIVIRIEDSKPHSIVFRWESPSGAPLNEVFRDDALQVDPAAIIRTFQFWQRARLELPRCEEGTYRLLIEVDGKSLGYASLDVMAMEPEAFTDRPPEFERPGIHPVL